MDKKYFKISFIVISIKMGSLLIAKKIINENKPIKEEWKDIGGYEDRYQISNFGRVWSKRLERILLTQLKCGYPSVGLRKGSRINKKIFYVHILVAKHFIKNPLPELFTKVDHIKNDKTNNHISNLRWFSPALNSLSYQTYYRKKNKHIILQIDLNNNLIRQWAGIDDLLKENCTFYRQGFVCHLKNGETYKYRDYLWKYKDYVKEEIKLAQDEVFLNIGIFDAYDFSNYEVSNYGKIRHVKRKNCSLKAAIGTKGYYKVILRSRGRDINMDIHRVVAYKFVEGRTETKNYVNHKDKNKLNNHKDNLEWLTNRKNTIHAMGKKVYQLDINTGEIIRTFDSLASATKKMGRWNSSCISAVCHGIKKTCYGYKWSFVDNENKEAST